MPAFRSQVERIAKALIENGGKLQARDLTSLLAEPRRLRPRVAWPPPEQWTNEMLDEHEQHVREHFPDEWEAWQAELNDGAHEGGTPGSEASPAAGPTASRG